MDNNSLLNPIRQSVFIPCSGPKLDWRRKLHGIPVHEHSLPLIVKATLNRESG